MGASSGGVGERLGMGGETELGKGLFGYRKSTVNQIITDRDQMLRQAEGRVRTAESRVAALETELTAMRDRNSRMDDQLDRLRVQLEDVVRRTHDRASGSMTAPAREAAGSPDLDAPAATPPAEPGPHSGEGSPVDPPGPSRGEDPRWTATDDRGDAGWPAAPSQGLEVGAAPPSAGHDRYEPDAIEETLTEADPTNPQPAPDDPEAGSYSEPFGIASGVHDAAWEGWGSPGELDDLAVAGDRGPEEEAWPPPAEVGAPDPSPDEHAEEPPSSRIDDLTARFLNDELAAVRRAAEESASRIVERARIATEGQIAESNRLWREVQVEVSRFAAWRQDVEPVIRAVQSKVEDVRTYIDEVPERIRQALAPVAESISAIDTDLAELSARANPPLMLTPSDVPSAHRDLGEDVEPEEIIGPAVGGVDESHIH